MSTISTHVLDTARGRPAAGVPIELSVREGESWRVVGRGETDADGRVRALAPDGLTEGTWRMRFETGGYHQAQGIAPFYPWAEVVFRVDAAGEHYHVPLLLSPYGYSTYRGS